MSSARAWVTGVRRHLRELDFWIVQLLAVSVAAVHIAVEATHVADRIDLGGLEQLPVVLHMVPVVYAGLRYGYEGSILTGLWSGLLAVPNLVLWHGRDYDWIGDAAFVLAVVVLGVVVAIPVERERRQRREVEEARRRLASYARAVIGAQERERARVARDLHDTIAQDLVRLGRQLDASGDSSSGELARAVLRAVRDVMRDLRPNVLHDLGLVAAVAALAEELEERCDLRADVEIVGEPARLRDDVELGLYRICQEALRNVEQHAHAHHVLVRLVQEASTLQVVIRDDGVGLAAGAGTADGGLGITGMRERAHLVGGEMTLRSGPVGTEIRVRVPT